MNQNKQAKPAALLTGFSTHTESPVQPGAPPFPAERRFLLHHLGPPLLKSLLSSQAYFSAQKKTESIFCSPVRAVWACVRFEDCSFHFKSTRVFHSWRKRLHRSCEEAQPALPRDCEMKEEITPALSSSHGTCRLSPGRDQGGATQLWRWRVKDRVPGLTRVPVSGSRPGQLPPAGCFLLPERALWGRKGQA